MTPNRDIHTKSLFNDEEACKSHTRTGSEADDVRLALRLATLEELSVSQISSNEAPEDAPSTINFKDQGLTLEELHSGLRMNPLTTSQRADFTIVNAEQIVTSDDLESNFGIVHASVVDSSTDQIEHQSAASPVKTSNKSRKHKSMCLASVTVLIGLIVASVVTTLHVANNDDDSAYANSADQTRNGVHDPLIPSPRTTESTTIWELPTQWTTTPTGLPGSPTPTKSLTSTPSHLPTVSSESCDVGINTEEELRTAIQDAANAWTNPTDIILCPQANIVLSSPINISNKAFRLTCPMESKEPCVISGGDTTQIFVGSPNAAVFERLHLVHGNAIFANIDEEGSGGALHLSSGRASFIDCVMVNNKAYLEGGAIYVDYGAKLSIARTNFTKNQSMEKGGGAILVRGEATLSGSRFLQNDSRTFGGAISVSGGQTSNINAFASISDTAFFSNIGLFGGALAVFNSIVELESVTFMENHLDESECCAQGKDIYISDNFASPFVNCSSTLPVVFCDAMDADATIEHESPSKMSTNCKEHGIQGVAGQESCRPYWF